MLRRLSGGLPGRAGPERCEWQSGDAHPPCRARRHRDEPTRQRRHGSACAGDSGTGGDCHLNPRSGGESGDAPALSRHAAGHPDAHTPVRGPNFHVECGANRCACRTSRYSNPNSDPYQNADRDTLANIAPANIPATNVPASDVSAADVSAANIPASDVSAGDVAARDIPAANGASSDVDATKGINCAATHTCACDHLSTTCGLIRLRRLQSGFLSGCA